MFDHVFQDVAPFDVAQDRAGRNANDRVLPVLAGLQRPVSRFAGVGHPVPDPDQMHEAADVLVGLDDDVTTPTAIAAIGTASGNMRLASKAARTASAVSGFTKNRHLIDKHSQLLFIV